MIRRQIWPVRDDSLTHPALLGINFLVNGATRFDEPGVLMSFEENADELATDVASLGYDLQSLIDQGLLVVDYVHVDRSEIDETGASRRSRPSTPRSCFSTSAFRG